MRNPCCFSEGLLHQPTWNATCRPGSTHQPTRVSTSADPGQQICRPGSAGNKEWLWHFPNERFIRRNCTALSGGLPFVIVCPNGHNITQNPQKFFNSDNSCSNINVMIIYREESYKIRTRILRIKRIKRFVSIRIIRVQILELFHYFPWMILEELLIVA